MEAAFAILPMLGLVQGGIHFVQGRYNATLWGDAALLLVWTALCLVWGWRMVRMARCVVWMRTGDSRIKGIQLRGYGHVTARANEAIAAFAVEDVASPHPVA